MYKDVKTIYLKYSTTLKVKTETGEISYLVPAGTQVYEYGWITDEKGMVEVTLPLQDGVLFTGKIHESLVYVEVI